MSAFNYHPAEEVFRERLIRALDAGGIRASRETAIRCEGSTPLLLRCDITVSPAGGVRNAAVIECKISADAQSLSTALGQALLYRRAFGADVAIICFPSQVQIPDIFLGVCRDNGILIATETVLTSILDPTGELKAKKTLRTLVAWLREQNPDEWSEKQREAWRSRLQPIEEFRQKLLSIQSR